MSDALRMPDGLYPNTTLAGNSRFWLTQPGCQPSRSFTEDRCHDMLSRQLVLGMFREKEECGIRGPFELRQLRNY